MFCETRSGKRSDLVDKFTLDTSMFNFAARSGVRGLKEARSAWSEILVFTELQLHYMPQLL